MDILKILRTDAQNVSPEDLAMFEDALSTGDYENTFATVQSDAMYQKECQKLISQIRSWAKTNATVNEGKDGSDPAKLEARNSGVIVDGKDLSPFNAPVEVSRTAVEEVASDLAAMRRSEDYKKRFGEYITESDSLTEDFIDKNFGLFEQLELDCMLSSISFSEAFLEKRFSQLNHSAIARHQFFSEKFFRKHFADLDADIVLQKGVNPWRKKDKRSNELDVFLRLKGIRQ